MTNHEITARFTRIADILEIQGENVFKVRAYRRAAETINDLEDSLADIAARDGLEQIDGFGAAIVAKTKDFLATGTTKLYEEIKDTVPLGVVAMAGIPGIGPKTVQALWQGLNVETIDALEAAAREGRVQQLAGFGAAKEKGFLEAIARWRRLSARVPLYLALPYAERLVRSITALPGVDGAATMGEIRRGCDEVTALVLAITTSSPQVVADALPSLPGLSAVGILEDRRITAQCDLNLPVRFLLGEPDSLGTISVEATGSDPHVDELRTLSGGTLPSHPTEADVYTALNLPFIAPELRDQPDILQTARAGTLPNLITEADFRGQLHCHSTYSDGAASILQMAQAAMARSYDYLAITDHSRSLVIANGLTRDRLLKQLDEIDTLNAALAGRFTILKGQEVDILADGSLDCDDDILPRLDIVVGSVHIRHKEDADAMTARMIRALENPHLHILGHPTGRLLGRREPYPLHLPTLYETAARTGTILEINAAPERMDLRDVYAREAKAAGVKLTINTDAHSPNGLGGLFWGLCMARRAGLTASDVVNTFPLHRLRAALKRG